MIIGCDCVGMPLGAELVKQGHEVSGVYGQNDGSVVNESCQTNSF